MARSDPEAFNLEFKVPEEKTQKIVFEEKSKKLHVLYNKVRNAREKQIEITQLPLIWDQLKSDYPNEWLLSLEIAELLNNDSNYSSIVNEIIEHLFSLSNRNTEYATLINNGLKLYLNITPAEA